MSFHIWSHKRKRLQTELTRLIQWELESNENLLGSRYQDAFLRRIKRNFEEVDMIREAALYQKAGWLNTPQRNHCTLVKVWVQNDSSPTTLRVYTSSFAPRNSKVDLIWNNHWRHSKKFHFDSHLVLFCPSFTAVCRVTILPSSKVTRVFVCVIECIGPMGGKVQIFWGAAIIFLRPGHEIFKDTVICFREFTRV